MSKKDKKAKFLELEGVRVSYRPKDDTIHITSTDRDLVGEDFHLTLKQGSPSEDALRNLLKKQGLINDLDPLLPQNALPKMAAYPFGREVVSAAWSDIPIGVKADGSPLLWNTKILPHFLLAGTTGSGKSIIQRNILNHCVMHNHKWRLLGIDLKIVELKPYIQYSRTVQAIATTLEDSLKLLRYAKEIMLKRYEKMAEAGVNYFEHMVDPETKSPYHAIMLLIDEAYMLLAPERETTEKDLLHNKLRWEARDLVYDIARLGRAAGIHMTLATQRPDATVITGDLKKNIDFRVAAGRLSATPSTMVLGSRAAENLTENIRGRGYFRGTSEEGQFQAYFSSFEELDKYILANPTIEPERYAQLIAQQEEKGNE